MYLYSIHGSTYMPTKYYLSSLVVAEDGGSEKKVKNFLTGRISPCPLSLQCPSGLSIPNFCLCRILNYFFSRWYSGMYIYIYKLFHLYIYKPFVYVYIHIHICISLFQQYTYTYTNGTQYTNGLYIFPFVYFVMLSVIQNYCSFRLFIVF